MNILLLCSSDKLAGTRSLICSCYPDCTVNAFSGAAEALTYIEIPAHSVDICFTEIILNDISGFRFVEILRNRDKKVKIVLIAPDDRFALEGWRYGMNDYLIEPLSLKSIQHTLHSCAEELPPCVV